MIVRTALFALMLALALPGCGGGKDKDKDHKDHDHKDHSHKDHDHKDEAKDHKDEAKDHKDEAPHDGPKKTLGKADIGGFVVEVTLIGEVKAGAEAAVDVTLTAETGKTTAEPQAVRAWVGAESGESKAKLDKEGKDYHGHIDVPNPIPADSQLWIEVQDAEGKKSAKGFSLK